MSDAVGELVDLTTELALRLPRAAKRLLAVFVLLTAVLAPSVVQAAFSIWLRVESQVLMQRVEPLLHQQIALASRANQTGAGVALSRTAALHDRRPMP